MHRMTLLVDKNVGQTWSTKHTQDLNGEIEFNNANSIALSSEEQGLYVVGTSFLIVQMGDLQVRKWFGLLENLVIHK